MTRYLALLGRQPALGLAELESRYGNAAVQALGDTAAIVEHEIVEFRTLGGSIKLAVVIETLDTSKWSDIETYLIKHPADLLATPIDGKLQLGLSAYGFTETAQRVNATGLSLKKAFRKAGHSVRLVPNQEPALSSAQVFHNKLVGDKGLEVIVATDGPRTVIARSQAVQDIDSYTMRDRQRPKRDARVGMLPPKLAQIIINLATGSNTDNFTLLDPFCGTGVILQEATLMGHPVIGTDLDNRMVDYSETNLRWLLRNDDIAPITIEVADATTNTWGAGFTTSDRIASETYLGRPFTSLPDTQTLKQTIADCNLIIKKFLQNVARQSQPGFRLCIAVPAWQIRPGQFQSLPLVDQIESMGYNRVKFEHVRDDQLRYYREDQIVARELLVLIRN